MSEEKAERRAPRECDGEHQGADVEGGLSDAFFAHEDSSASVDEDPYAAFRVALPPGRIGVRALGWVLIAGACIGALGLGRVAPRAAIEMLDWATFGQYGDASQAGAAARANARFERTLPRTP
jgi:hypothetical protein